MITEQEILDLGFTKETYSNDAQGVYKYSIERKDLSEVPPFHIYYIYWDYIIDFQIDGYMKRQGTEGVKTRRTKSWKQTFTDIEDLIEVLDRIIKADTNNYTGILRK